MTQYVTRTKNSFLSIRTFLRNFTRDFLPSSAALKILFLLVLFLVRSCSQLSSFSTPRLLLSLFNKKKEKTLPTRVFFTCLLFLSSGRVYSSTYPSDSISLSPFFFNLRSNCLSPIYLSIFSSSFSSSLLSTKGKEETLRLHIRR